MVNTRGGRLAVVALTAAALAGAFEAVRRAGGFDYEFDRKSGDLDDPDSDDRRRCLTCQMVEPLPTQSCWGGHDHFLGPDQPGTCAHCGRLLHACNTRPCQRRRP